MNFKSAKILTTLILSGMLFIGCGGGSDSAAPSTAPVFSSATVADDLLDGNFTTTTVIYDATADNDVNVTYILASGIVNNDLFNIASDGNITFKALPTISGAHNDYNLTITATDTAHNHTDHNVTLRVMNDVIDLGVYGNLIAPAQVNGNWYYFWDLSGDGAPTHWSTTAGTLNGGNDYTTHDFLDGLFNHNINGVANTNVSNVDGFFGTTNDYRYATINGVSVALLATGTGLANEGAGWYSLNDNQTTYTDLAAVWDAHNTGVVGSSGIPAGWQEAGYWSATPSDDGHAAAYLIDGLVSSYSDFESLYVAVQVR